VEAPGTADGSLCRGFAWFYWLFGRRGTYAWMSFDVAFAANQYMEFREVPDLVACGILQWASLVGTDASPAETASAVPASLRDPSVPPKSPVPASKQVLCEQFNSALRQ
jgi:hypothetical protein